MNTDPENFDLLKPLLALKRHEQPPPRFFDELPSRIRARLEREEQEVSWLERLLPSFVFKPAVAYGVGFVFCGLMIVGIGSALRNAPDTSTNLVQENGMAPLVPVAPAAALVNGSPALKMGTAQTASSTNPMTTTPGSLFDGLPAMEVRPASHQTP